MSDQNDERPDELERREGLPARVDLEPGYNPALDPVVREVLRVDPTDEEERNRIEREAIEQTENGPKSTDRAAVSQEPELEELEAEDEPGEEPA